MVITGRVADVLQKFFPSNDAVGVGQFAMPPPTRLRFDMWDGIARRRGVFYVIG
jgi:hypothetical protein